MTIYSAGRLQLFPDHFDINGIGISFAVDSRSYRIEATEMSNLLHQRRFKDWVSYNSQFHVKLYSLAFALLGSVLGFNILAAEPLNLVYYLSILTLVYALGRKAFNSEVGLIAAGIVSVWPSLLLHTTQMLRDPLFIASLLLLTLVLLTGLTDRFSRAQALMAAAAGAGSCVLLWRSRGDMWELVFLVVLMGVGMTLAHQFSQRKFFNWNILFATLLLFSAFLIPRIVPTYRQSDGSLVKAPSVSENPVKNASSGEPLRKQSPSARWSHFAARLGLLRHKFIVTYPLAGSNIDLDVELNGTKDIVMYLPRAMLIGLFAPFPNMWLARGQRVGVVGRLVGGAETLIMYALSALAFVGVIRNRRRLHVWLLLFIVILGCTAMGYVVVNISTLYRMRYGFWILLIVVAAKTIQSSWQLESRTARASEKPSAELQSCL